MRLDIPHIVCNLEFHAQRHAVIIFMRQFNVLVLGSLQVNMIITHIQEFTNKISLTGNIKKENWPEPKIKNSADSMIQLNNVEHFLINDVLLKQSYYLFTTTLLYRIFNEGRIVDEYSCSQKILCSRTAALVNITKFNLRSITDIVFVFNDKPMIIDFAYKLNL